MSSGFKSSLFGFNKTDVIEYIEKSHKQSAKNAEDLNLKIEELMTENQSLKDDIAVLTAERESVKRLQSEYIEKYKELEKISEDIDKLYLSAKANAKEVTDRALREREIIDKEIVSNINAIDEMHSSLVNLKSDILSSAASFSNELEKLFTAFNEAKAQLSESEINNK